MPAAGCSSYIDCILCHGFVAGAYRDGLLKDESKWDYVRKGICCVCCESNINSLLYR